MSQAIIHVTGVLGKDAEQKFFPDGRKYYRLSVPVSKGKDKPTTWFDCILQGTRADNDKFISFLKKKAGVSVDGEYVFSTYEKPDGTLGFNHTVYISHIDITKYADDGGQQAKQEEETPF